MSWKMDYVAGKETLVVAPSGCVTEDDAIELTDQAIARLQETRASRVLGDCRRMESAPSAAQLYWLVHNYANRGLPRAIRIAVVHPNVPQAADVARFYETVCLNQHYQARVFQNKEAAEAWLWSNQNS
jgi:hypothetical protein